MLGAHPAMPETRYLDDFMRQEVQRHTMTQLRSSNRLERVQSTFVPGPVSSVYPFGRSHPNCCHISSLFNASRRPNHPVGCMSRKSAPMAAWDDYANIIDRRYELLQREALRQAQFAQHVARDHRMGSKRMSKPHNYFLNK